MHVLTQSKQTRAKRAHNVDILELIEPLQWMEKGACKDMNPDLFFPHNGENNEEAKAVCIECPVQQECLDYAVSQSGLMGIWGGLSETERRTVRRKRGLIEIR